MGGVSPWVVSSLLTALGIFGTLLGLWLARRGKREDNKRAETQQTFDQLQAIADSREQEIIRKDSELTRLTGQRDAAYTEVERLRSTWEERWDRQMGRCRTITAALVKAVSELREAAGPAAGDLKVEEAVQALQDHNTRDHEQD